MNDYFNRRCYDFPRFAVTRRRAVRPFHRVIKLRGWSQSVVSMNNFWAALDDMDK